MLEGLDEIDWKNVKSGFGTSERIPEFIRDIASDDADTRFKALSDLGIHIDQEGTRFEASALVVPFLIELLTYDTVQDKDEIKLNAKEWRILSLIDGTRPVQELINQSGYDEFAVYKILHKISSSKLIEEVNVAQAEIKTAPGGAAVTATDTGAKKTVLVIDDKSQVRSILRFSLKDAGFNTILASNGREGLKFALSENPPDLIIIDIVMPDMPGLEVISQLRDSDLTKHVPIIILTGNARKNDILKGIELGASDYMLKPFKFADLHVKIRKLLYP